jgi:hypothetical protein
MFSNVNDVVEAFTTMASLDKSGQDYSYESSEDYSGLVGLKVEEREWNDGITSTTKFTILFWLGISLVCLALCVVICWQDKKPAQAQSTTSRSLSRPRGVLRSDFWVPPRRERSESIWSKIFSKDQDESKGWLALRRFASRLNSQARDVEMQRVQPIGSALHQPRDWAGAARNPAQAGPTLHSGTRGTRRLQRPEHLRTNRSRPEGWRAETERQRLRDAWDQLDVRAGETFQTITLQPLASQPRPDSPVIPEPVAQPNVGRFNGTPLLIYEPFRRAESPAPSIREVPPTYAQHTNDEVAYLYDDQNPAHATEEARDVQGLPPYTPLWLPAPAPVLSSQPPVVI